MIHCLEKHIPVMATHTIFIWATYPKLIRNASHLSWTEASDGLPKPIYPLPTFLIYMTLHVWFLNVTIHSISIKFYRCAACFIGNPFITSRFQSWESVQVTPGLVLKALCAFVMLNLNKVSRVPNSRTFL